MKQKMSVILTLCFFFILILGAYTFSGYKTIKRYTAWALGHLAVEEGKYDVIVVGSDPEGIAAAISAARSGARVLLLGKEDGPGGLLTYGMLNTLDMNRNSEEVILTRGIFSEFYAAIGKTESFDVNKAKEVFSKLISEEERLEYRPSYKFSKAILDGNTIVGVKMINSLGEEEIFYGKRIIDATQDGDVCADSGVPYFIGMEDINWAQNMAATLVFKVGGVKWKDIETDIYKYKAETNDKNCGFNKSTAWGFGKWCYDSYKPLNANMQLRGPNMGLQKDGTILINALQIFDVDGLNEESKAIAMEQGKKEAENIVKYLKTKLGSFKNAYLAGVADELYIRETRHIMGEYLLKATDILGNVNFYDKIAWASYPIDIQATNKNNTGYVIGVPDQYSIPYRCTVPLEIDNLYIVGKAASYTSVAAGSARVVPTGMAVGESTGIAAVYTIYKEVTPRELTTTKGKGKMKQLQGILKNQGVFLKEFNSDDPNNDIVGYDRIKNLINLGLLTGGYNNNFAFDTTARTDTFSYLLVNLLQRAGSEEYNFRLGDKLIGYAEPKNLTGGAAARICAILMGEYKEPSKVTKDFTLLENQYNNFKSAYTELGKDYDENNADHKLIKEKYEELKLQYDPIKKEYDKKLEERVKKIETETWEIAKDNGYFSEEFNKDETLTKRQMYIIGIDIIERFLGREIIF